MSAPSMADVLQRVRELPALPAVVLELIQSMGNADIHAEDLAEKISHDQALAAKTLRLANSSFYGISRQVTSISEATAILGLRTLRSVATAAGLVNGFPASGCKNFDFHAFWGHAIATALCARSLARAVYVDEDVAFTAGLVHDIGRLVLVSGFPDGYDQVIAFQHEHDGLPIDAERAVFGFDHAAMGGLIAEQWKFAPDIVRAIAQHHDPKPDGGSKLVDIVHIADNMAHALDLTHVQDDLVPSLSMAAWTRLSVDERVCSSVFLAAEEQYRAVCQSLLT